MFIMSWGYSSELNKFFYGLRSRAESQTISKQEFDRWWKVLGMEENQAECEE